MEILTITAAILFHPQEDRFPKFLIRFFIIKIILTALKTIFFRLRIRIKIFKSILKQVFCLQKTFIYLQTEIQ